MDLTLYSYGNVELAECSMMSSNKLGSKEAAALLRARIKVLIHGQLP